MVAALRAFALPVHLRVVFEARDALTLVLRQQRLGDRDSLLARRPANERQPETDVDAARAHALHGRAQLLGRVDDAQPARAVSTSQMLGRLGVAGGVDFRSVAFGRDERRVELPLLDSIILPFEIDFTLGVPEGTADGEELFRARVPLVVFEEVAVASLL